MYQAPPAYAPPLPQNQEVLVANHEQVARLRNVQQVNRLKQEQLNDGCLSVLILIIIFCFGATQSKDCSVAPLKLWMYVEAGYYFLNLAFVYVYYSFLKRHNSENMKFLFVNCSLNVLHTAWLIYGNIIFWPNYNTCSLELNTKYYASNLIWVMGFLIVFGYLTMCKCCTVSLVFVCFAPTIMRAYRNRNNVAANWQPTSQNILKNIVKKKFKPTEDGDVECPICMIEY